jgi:hypothetical protein
MMLPVRIAPALGILTIGLLNLIIALGLTGTSPIAFHAAVETLPWVLVASSLFLGTLFWRRGKKPLSACLLANIVMMIVAVFVNHGLQIPLNQSLLWISDLWWLNVHLIAIGMLMRVE